MQIEYLTSEQIVQWGTVFKYDTRDNLIADSNIDAWTTYPYPNVDYGLDSNDRGFISPLAGASAVILDIDVADESEYTASNVIVKVRPEAGGDVQIDPSTGENIASKEMEAVNLRGFQRSPSHKQVQVIVPLNEYGTFDYAYAVSGELPLLRHIKIIGKISEFDVESLNQGTKISQLPFSDPQIDDMFVVSRCKNDDGRKMLQTSGGGNEIPDFTEGQRDYNASYAVSLYHLKQGLGMGAYCSIVIDESNTIDNEKSFFVNCYLEENYPGGSNGAGTYLIHTTNGLYLDKKVCVLASSSSHSAANKNAEQEGGFISVGPPEFSIDDTESTLPAIPGSEERTRYNAYVHITQFMPSFRVIDVNVSRNDDRKDASMGKAYAPPLENTPVAQYAPQVLFVSFLGQ